MVILLKQLKGCMKMKWEEYKNKIQLNLNFEKREQVDVQCPNCGKNIYKRLDIVLTSYPEQYQYECDCGWVGYSYQ